MIKNTARFYKDWIQNQRKNEKFFDKDQASDLEGTCIHFLNLIICSNTDHSSIIHRIEILDGSEEWDFLLF